MSDTKWGAEQGEEPIAIIGAGCRLPAGVHSIDELLATFRGSRDCVTEVPASRWDVNAYYDPDPTMPGKSYVRCGGFVDDMADFDAGFFGISAAEAERMDPQQRIVLETVWHALEHGTQSPDELLQTDTGVFLAMMNTNDYSQLKGRAYGLRGISTFDTVGDAISITAGRIAYVLGLEGPCLALDTACSGSLVALHLARQSILSGECDTAIVAAVSAVLHPGVSIAFSKLGLMSRTGRCRAFDEGADGYVRGEGCVAVVLRRQSIALARGDRILASIVGSAINHDGKTAALTAPNGRAQERVMRLALARAGLDPADVGYVEAHGTGTPVGDPMEMSALVNVFGPAREADNTLYVGSSKTNFGHIEAGAGLLGLLKAALCLDSGEILPSLHFTRMSSNIDLRRAPIQVPTTPIPWPRGDRPRVVGVNSFGYSGTNAHVIMVEAPQPMSKIATSDTADPRRTCELLVLSATCPESLRAMASDYATFLEREDSTALSDIAFTAAIGRAHLSRRLAVVGHSRGEIAKKLRSWQNDYATPGIAVSEKPARRKPKVAFVFTGQGVQYAGMAKELYEFEPTFARAIEQCAAIMDDRLGDALTEVLFGPSSAQYLNDTRYAQPALFAVEYALAELIKSWGVEPFCLMGHSVGEIVAACVGGVLSLEDAAMFVVLRGRLMSELPRTGKMLALDASVAEANDWIAGHEAELSIAAVNGTRSVVIAGSAAAVAHVAERAAQARRRAKELDVSHAFHSPMMDPILDEIERLTASFRTSPANTAIISNVTGKQYASRLPPQYWRTHVRAPVLFYEGLQELSELGCTDILEIGPHPALLPAMSGAVDGSRTRCMPTLMRGRSDLAQLFSAVGSLFVTGTPVAFDRIHWHPSSRRVPLPLYPFKRDRYWLSKLDTGLINDSVDSTSEV